MDRGGDPALYQSTSVCISGRFSLCLLLRRSLISSTGNSKRAGKRKKMVGVRRTYDGDGTQALGGYTPPSRPLFRSAQVALWIFLEIQGRAYSMIGTSLQYLQIAVYFCSLIISTVAIAGRIWARNITRKRWQANDYLMVVSWVCTPPACYLLSCG
jgi:hypothetical protein